MSLDKIYPLIIVKDRYSGMYSKAEYLAFNLCIKNFPHSVGGDDIEEERFWRNGEHESYKIGKGNTPHDALRDLHKILYGG